ncbi:DNA excision repair protein ERCC-1-like [Uloborus diversus]|uniref:DNA excision repair protein ERCC-1-like n=1 Tax=Uloborus diversus TaxID=327109 RepID=UPI00240915E3|nr:DNA excision repair protein ERCC-1-like [Uloborus diversus]
MEKSPRKFSIPETLDDSTNGASSGPQYFKPGIILKEAEKNKTTSGQKEETTDICLKKPPLGSSGQEIKIINSNESGSMQTLTKFGTEFANLKESKYYDKSVESTGSSSGIVQRSSGTLLVNPRQRGNPLLKIIRNVPWEFTEIEPDYVMGKTACALFLSLRYHNLLPNYIHDRLKALGKSYALRVLLVQVDVAEPNPPLKDLSVISILADCTLMVCWSAEEAGTYLETYKMFENKSADLIKEKQDSDKYSQLIDCLTTIRSINKTDAMVLLSNFKTLKGIILASVEDLAMCPGLGPLKAKRLYDALRKPLKNEQEKA